MRRNNLFRGIRIMLIPLFSLAPLLIKGQQDAKDLLFQETEQAMQQARDVQAEIFSPTNFKTAMKNYEEADEDYIKSKNLEDIRKKLKMSAVYFLKAVETTKIAQTNLIDCINARNDALSSEAPVYRKKEWEDAESALKQATKTLEEGDLKGAKSRARKAERLYRQVELESIKANYLDETMALLNEAEEKDIKKRAPLTLAKSNELVAKAEKLLIENRYDTDEARQIAQEAKYEAQHAAYIANLIERLKEENQTVEEILLNNEKPIQKIADELDLNARFHEGSEQAANNIIQNIKKLKKDFSSLKQDIEDKNEQIATMTGQISEMESKLGDLKSREATLTQLMEQQKLWREKFAKIEKSFTSEEAQIVRVGDHVVIRLYGLSFPVGKATINSEYFGLLSKVLKAIEEYPESGITVEGHTDSWGSDQANQKLSTERATAVREYLQATASIDSSRINAVGYGESKPVASNETKEGRRKNRRIDVVIIPKK